MSDAQTPDLRAHAREMHDAGLCVLPVRTDGSKAPDVRSWMAYKVNRSTPEEHDQWFAGGRRTGIGIVTGAVSGNIELIEFEGLAVREGVLEGVAELALNSGLGDLWKAVTTGWADETPSGGVHYVVMVSGRPAAGNVKLARRLARVDEYTPEERQRVAEKPNTKIVRVLAETRGEGGFMVAAPSHGSTHPSGRPYTRLSGGPSTMATVEPEDLDALYALCRAHDAMPTEEKAKTAPRPRRELPAGHVRPGDDFENKVGWTEIIGNEFDALFTRGNTTYLRRKGKTKGISATTGHAADRDRLYVFTTSTVFEAEVPYDKFAAYTLLNYGGTSSDNFKQAAAELRRRGYGSEAPRRRLSSVPAQGGAPFNDGSSALHPATAEEIEPDFETGPELHVVHPARPELDITNEADAVDGLLAIMAGGQLPDLYKRSGGPCWVHQDDNGNPLTQQLGNDNLRAYLADHVTTYQVVTDPLTEGTKEVRELLMPKTCGTVLGRKDWPLPPLRGIVTSPVIRLDGTLLQAPGYDTATGLYLQPRVPLRRLQPHVSEASLEKAKEIIFGQMLADFPWAQPSDRAHFIGALLTPILRPYFHGPTPMFIVSATAPGSGKSLLKDIFKACFGISETAWPENDTELRKSITTQLYTTGQPVVVLDNLPNGHIIKSPVLSSLLTAEHWGDRVLGSTASVTMPNNRLWIVTGNGLRTGGDNLRRAMWVRLDPNCPDPDQRDGFRVGDLRPWLRANASTVVAALVTMVRSWVAAGAPTIRTRKGDYSEWATIVAGLLGHLGVTGWMSDRDDAIQQDDETQEWAAFLIAWSEKLEDNVVTAGTALTSLSEHVPRYAKTGEAPTAKVLGNWLKARDGRYFGDRKIKLIYDSHRCQNTYRVDVHGRALQPALQ
ncbi:bifunctional DNA primase/polymerase [Streptomyces sp. H27-H5]|uniref:bifunctional DNA primase/polymerase n=1 Tax=Streptomyces sp. H27-H5 TaxID=2996460 RepID=UPI00226E99E3|nr:bifunctional DNA primase/polymerase [Streptomyces sp. H27-H5]MCY0961544.1 bifunctional DNA primase/polymerase [Streptomyces sp. H27-H5]